MMSHECRRADALAVPPLLPVYQRRRLERLEAGPRHYNLRDTVNVGLERAGLIRRTGNADRFGRPEWAITEAGRAARPRGRSA